MKDDQNQTRAARVDLALAIFALLAIMSSWSIGQPGPVGILFANNSYAYGTTYDIYATENSSPGAYSILGLVTWGDASITGARSLGPDGRPRLGRLAHVDVHSETVFGISYYQTTAYGLLP